MKVVGQKFFIAKNYKGKQMTYSLVKVGSPSIGDSGPMSVSLWSEDGELKQEHNSRPVVGRVIRVGSYTARSYDEQDWWQTSLINEILEDKENYVKFVTNNSTYEWRKF